MNALGFLPAGPIKAPRVELTPYSLLDYPEFEAFRENIPATPYLGAFAKDPKDVDIKAEWNTRVWNRPNARVGDTTVLAVTYYGAIAGEIHITFGNKRNRTYYLSWIMDPDLQGRGLGTEAITRAVIWLFDNGAHRLVASIEPDNVASMAVATKAGFRFEGTARKSLHRDGEWFDVNYFAITEEDPRGTL